MSANYTDNNLATVVWDWGNGITSAGNIDFASSTITGSHNYATSTGTGVYQVALTVKDFCDITVSKTFEYVVVYDPSGGFVTGGGFVNSPAGALREDETLTGKANFGFVAKYQKGAANGQTEFQFHSASFNFKSTSYESTRLVISGNKANYKGEGTIAGREGTFGFMVSAVYGQYNGGTAPDRFRIKIWELLVNGAEGELVYDNILGTALENYNLTTNAGTIISGGSIVTHNAKKSERVADQADMNILTTAQVKTYPNPFKNKANIEIAFDKDEEYVLDIYDLRGSLVKHLNTGKANAGNIIQATWEPKDSAQGVYIMRLVTKNGVHNLRLVRE